MKHRGLQYNTDKLLSVLQAWSHAHLILKNITIIIIIIQIRILSIIISCSFIAFSSTFGLNAALNQNKTTFSSLSINHMFQIVSG